MADEVNSIASSIMEQYGQRIERGSTGDELGKDAFLNLLVKQLQYQDPLNPMENKDFLAQMAQFSALEQMQNLNSSASMSQGYALLGKTILGVSVHPDTLEQTYVEGVVSAVTNQSGKVYLDVGGKDVALDKVEAVLPDAVAQSSAYSLIGKSIQGAIVDPTTLEVEEVEGVVTGIKSVLGELYAQVDSKLVPLGNVSAVTADSIVKDIESLKESVEEIKKHLNQGNEE